MSEHDPNAYMCSCLICWCNDVADQKGRDAKRIKELADELKQELAKAEGGSTR